MANPIIKIKRSNAAAGILGTPDIPTLVAGEFGVDQINKNLYLGLQDAAGAVMPVIVGGEGTFAKKTDVSNALTNGLKYKGEITITNAHLLDTAFTDTAGSLLEPPLTGFYYSVGSVTGGGVFKYGTATPPTEITLVEGDALVKTNGGWQRLVGGTALSEAISDLGDVFHYAGTVSAVDGTTPYDLTTLSDTDTGAYYKVGLTGIYTDGATTFNAKAGDAFVKTTGAWQKLDNVDVVVSGTTDEITVTGNEDTGYVVSLTTGTPNSWKDGVEDSIEDLETKTQNIDLTDTTANTTRISGNVVFGTGLNAHNFKVSSSGTVSINAMTNSATVESYGTLNITAGGGMGSSGSWIGLQSNGHLVATGTGSPEIQGFIIDGGAY